MKLALLAAAALPALELLREQTMPPVIRRETVFLSGLRKPLRLIQISDLHNRSFGTGQKQLLERVQGERPSLIALTGDVISRSGASFPALEDLLRRLCAIAPVYAAMGNHELDFCKDPKNERALLACYRAAGAKLLRNETVPFEVGGAPLYLAGCDLDRRCYRNEQGGYSHLYSVQPRELDAWLGKKQGTTVLLAHNPLFFSAYAAWGADLTLSGHLHGGMLRLPAIGGVLSPERRLFPRYDRGLYAIDGHRLSVSAGLGKLRLCNPPELVSLSLLPARNPQKKGTV